MGPERVGLWMWMDAALEGSHKKGKEGLRWPPGATHGPSCHWVQRTLHPWKMEFSIFILFWFWSSGVLNQHTLLNKNLSSAFFLLKYKYSQPIINPVTLMTLSGGHPSPSLQLWHLAGDANAPKSSPTDILPATQMVNLFSRSRTEPRHLHFY